LLRQFEEGTNSCLNTVLHKLGLAQLPASEHIRTQCFLQQQQQQQQQEQHKLSEQHNPTTFDNSRQSV
jgi:hypothetical protein